MKSRGQDTRVEYGGRQYLWDGGTWHDCETHGVPPARVTQYRYPLLPPTSVPADADIRDPDTLLQRAKEARDLHHLTA